MLSSDRSTGPALRAGLQADPETNARAPHDRRFGAKEG